MAFEQEQRDALYLLRGLEEGSMSTSAAAHAIGNADPALVYLILTWIRSRYGGDHPAAEGVLGRLVELNRLHASVKSRMREGKADPIAVWFEEEYEYREFDAVSFVALVVEKLEG